MDPSDIGLLIRIYNTKGKSKFELKIDTYGYTGGIAEKKIQRFIDMGILKVNGGKLLNSDNDKILEKLKENGLLDVLEKIVDDSDPTLEEKLLRKLKK